MNPIIINIHEIVATEYDHLKDTIDSTSISDIWAMNMDTVHNIKMNIRDSILDNNYYEDC